MEGGGARGERDGVPGADVVGEARLELGCPRAGRDPARAQRLDDRLDLLVADRGRLKAEQRLASRSRRLHA